MKLDKPQSNVQRFVSQDPSQAQAAKRPLAPGPVIVQVELRTPLEPTSKSSHAASQFSFASPTGVDLSQLQQVLTKHGLVKSEPSFRSPVAAPKEAGAIQADVFQDPRKRQFVDLHFPADADAKSIVAELREMPEVQRAVVMPKAIPPNVLPTDPLIGTSDQVVTDPATGLESEWYVYRCGVNQAWNTCSGQGVIIADIDFGFLVTHEDLVPNLDMSHAHNSFDGSINVSAGENIDHGTGVLGLAGAASNGIGMAGFAFRSTLWPIQANAGQGTQLPGDAFANAIEWLINADTGGKRLVINLEAQTGQFGNYEMVPAVNFAIQNAIAKGIVVCVAAGNGDRDAGIDDDGSPIPPTGSILVGATQYDPSTNSRASFSNFGSRVVVSAPGDLDHDLTCSTSSNDAYRNGFGGTSGATPKVSGAVAQMLEANASLTQGQIINILTSTGTPISTDVGKPVGVFLDVASAVAQAVALKAETVPA